MTLKFPLRALLILSLFICNIYAKDISNHSLIRIQDDIDKTDLIESSARQRRDYKKIIRSANSLLQRHIDAENRFVVMGKIMECQKKLINLNENKDIQSDLLETCKMLLQAPDKYAYVRVEADSIFTQLNMSQDNESEDQKLILLAEFADRYQNTSGEAKSLIVASELAFDLGDKVLLKAFRDKLSSEFNHDSEARTFLRKRFAVRSGFSVQGTFERADKKIVSFPNGTAYIICFWSKDADLLDRKIAEIENSREAYKDKLKVYSFNLDELRDSGARILKKRKLDWILMNLPGGASNPLFESTGASNDFYTVLIDSFGISVGENDKKVFHLKNKPISKKVSEIQGEFELQPLMRYLFNGEFFIQDPVSEFSPNDIPELKRFDRKTKLYTSTKLTTNEKSIPASTLKKIQSLLIDYPDNLSLEPEQALSHFIKVEKLCDETLKKFPNDPNRWIVHNRRIVALLGQWRLKGDYELFNRASQSAKQVISMDCPAEAKLLAHYFNANDNYYHKKMNAGAVLNQFEDDIDALSQTGRGRVALILLSILSQSEPDYKIHREAIFNGLHNDPSSWPVSSFLLDKSSAEKVFSKNFNMRSRGREKKGELVPTSKTLKASLTTIDGKTIQIPSGRQNLAQVLVFISKLETENGVSRTIQCLDHLKIKQNHSPIKNFQVLPVFLDCEDSAVQTFLKTNQYRFPAVHLKGKEKNTLVKQLGLYTMNDNPNVSILNENGEIQLSLSGLSRDSERESTLNHRVDQVLIEHISKLAQQSFLEKDYTSFIHRLKNSYPIIQTKDRRYRDNWIITNDHRRKLIWTYIETKQWNKALKLVNVNIKAPGTLHNNRRYKGGQYCSICYKDTYGMVFRASLLRQLGKVKEADQILRDVDYPKCANGRKITDVIKAVKRHIERYINSDSSDKDKEEVLSKQEKLIRKGKQDRYNYKLENDYLIRSEIYKNMGRTKEAEADLRVAKTLSWPYETKKYDIHHTLEFCKLRKEQAKEDLRKKNYKKAIERVSFNIKIHEDEAVRCKSGCMACGDQIISFQLRAESLKILGKHEEAKWSFKMAEAIQCPEQNVDEYHNIHPLSRSGKVEVGKGRLELIKNYMLGKSWAKPIYHSDRHELADNLRIRAEAYKALGENEKAEIDEERAFALTYPSGVEESIESSKEEMKYVEMVRKVAGR